MKCTGKSPSVVMVLQSLPPLPSGGAEIQALRLAEELMSKGIQVMFITPGVGKIKGYTEINGVPVYRLHTALNLILDILFSIQKKAPAPKVKIEYDDSVSSNNTISRKIGFGARLRYNIFLINAWLFLRNRKEKFDILHSHTVEWPAYVGAVLSKLLKKKLVVKDSTMNGIFNILRYPNGQKKQQLIIRHAQFVAMTNIIEENFHKAGIPENKIYRIPNGIRINDIFKKDYASAGKVLFAGNLYQQPAKGIDILLKAWKIVSAQLPEVTLQVVGDGDLNAYRQYAKLQNIDHSVVFLGKRNDVDQLMLEADIFVLPSRREGMPNVLMEAMLKALPCVASNISGNQDLITHGVNGLLVEPAKIEELAKGLIYMFTNRQEAGRMGANARQTIIESFNIKKVAEQYAALYNL